MLNRLRFPGLHSIFLSDIRTTLSVKSSLEVDGVALSIVSKPGQLGDQVGLSRLRAGGLPFDEKQQLARLVCLQRSDKAIPEALLTIYLS